MKKIFFIYQNFFFLIKLLFKKFFFFFFFSLLFLFFFVLVFGFFPPPKHSDQIRIEEYSCVILPGMVNIGPALQDEKLISKVLEGPW